VWHDLDAADRLHVAGRQFGAGAGGRGVARLPAARAGRAVLEAAEAIPGRRHLKSHLPYDSLPVWEGVKFIHVARDGRDSAMSMHNHMRGFRPEMNAIMDQVSFSDPKFGDAAPPTPEDPAESFRVWLVDGGAWGDPGAPSGRSSAAIGPRGGTPTCYWSTSTT